MTTPLQTWLCQMATNPRAPQPAETTKNEASFLLFDHSQRLVHCKRVLPVSGQNAKQWTVMKPPSRPLFVGHTGRVWQKSSRALTQSEQTHQQTAGSKRMRVFCRSPRVCRPKTKVSTKVIQNTFGRGHAISVESLPYHAAGCRVAVQ